MFITYFHIFSPVRPSHDDGCWWSCDVSHHTISHTEFLSLIFSMDSRYISGCGFWLSYHNHVALCNVADVYSICSHLLTCTAFSRCRVMIVRHRMRSHNRHTTLIVFRLWLQFLADNSKASDLVRLSYDGRTVSYYFHTIIHVPAIVPNAQMRRKPIFSSVATEQRL